MDNDIVITRLERLRLHGMAEAAREMLLLPVQMRPGLETVLNRLIESEARHRDDCRTAHLLKAAKLFCKPFIEDVTCGTARNLTKETLEAIADCGFIRRGENLVITAKTG